MCHTEIHSQSAWNGDKRIATQKCAECHDDAHEAFHDSVHGQALRDGNMDSAACLDCHNLHEVKAIGAAGITKPLLFIPMSVRNVMPTMS